MEVSLSHDHAYVQQSLILKLRVISTGALASATPSLDDLDHAQTELLKGPVSQMRTGGDGREQVNDYYFLLRPLREGPLRIAPVRLSATDARGQRFELEAPSVPDLEVRPAPPELRPWLPLEALSLTARLDPTAEIAAGQPLTLTLELQAEGGTAEQLPSLEPLLASADFRRYRERTLSDTRLDADGRRLLARRTEIYTLVPQSEGALQLPPMRLQWWNVATNRLEVASLAQRSLGGPKRADARPSQPQEGVGPGVWLAWIPLIAVVLVFLGLVAGWRVKIVRVPAQGDSPTGGLPVALARSTLPEVAARLRSAQSLGRAAASIALRWSGMRTKASAGFAAWNARMTDAMADAVAGAMPASWRMRRWLRALRSCNDPDAFYIALRERAQQAAWLAPGEPLTHLAGKLTRPGTEQSAGQPATSKDAAWQSALRALFAELEAARYAARPLELIDWRRRLQRQLRWQFGGRWKLLSRQPNGALPPLNPAQADRGCRNDQAIRQLPT
ncbi:MULTISPECIES: BatD family protein [Thiorhodovibrio]|uniref:BatD family protein n=1 Tax=Thiorhodovibrio TaxID=61593 RepID=UPI001911D434|nr:MULTISPECIES: BatD family protein [Thiorhodovibrio]